MGRSAKFMKRPTKAEKVSRAITAPPKPSTTQRIRSLSPEDPYEPSPIPLFNTSAKDRGNGRVLETNRAKQTAARVQANGDDSLDGDEAHVDEDNNDDDDMTGDARATSTKPMSLKNKMKLAKEQMRIEQDKRNAKLSFGNRAGSKRKSGAAFTSGGKDKFKLGTDYVALHESRPGGAFKKKLR
ncbi:hypothetical protein OIO90_003702 [Microbotryomycetes sp. JL221]|nr:hypothetical protein OIO90_003702 [Microbotryomycetes sp. JL221]